jgi:hypothetical protein
MTLTIFGKNIFPLLLGFFITASFGACAKKYYFTTSSVTPAAEGKVKLRKDNNGNYSIDVSITHLARPQKLDPPKDVYIVWMETANKGIKNIGKINSKNGLISKTLKGSLSTTSSFKPTKVFITAEAQGDINRPGVPVVLTTEGF